MITMSELVDLRMQQQLAHEILYRQQIMQRIPDPFAAMMHAVHMAPHMLLPAHPPLPGVEAKLENNDLWEQFHKIGTEMIITKSGRRMFPSMRASLKGLEEESQYCVLIEMVPIGDCRYKFSGSQWVPAGGAEPQSPQRIYLHPDSPATGSHWQSQPILFNKVKLTNNTLDNNGHTVLASMHKYQPRIHVICTNDLSQIPWAPQQSFVFPETEFIAVTAYQNDRITKLKIDNNPFAKGFRESGQSKCKRKMSLSPEPSDENQNNSAHLDDDQSSVASSQDSPQTKRLCRREESLPFMDINSGMCYTLPPRIHDTLTPTLFPHLAQQTASMFMPSVPAYLEPLSLHRLPYQYACSEYDLSSCQMETARQNDEQNSEFFIDVVSTSSEDSQDGTSSATSSTFLSCDVPIKRTSFSISSILGKNTRNAVSV